jgi:hypothetical protein
MAQLPIVQIHDMMKGTFKHLLRADFDAQLVDDVKKECKNAVDVAMNAAIQERMDELKQQAQCHHFPFPFSQN